MIWLKTAKAPRPRAASVDDPANAAPGTSSARTMTAAASFLIVSASLGRPYYPPSGRLDGRRRQLFHPRISRPWLRPGHVEHRRVEPEGSIGPAPCSVRRIRFLA